MQLQKYQPEIVKTQQQMLETNKLYMQKQFVILHWKFTWEETDPAGGRFIAAAGMNLTVFGLMAETVVWWEDAIGGEALIAPARSSENDLKVEQVGLEATGLATTTLSASSISIINGYVCFTKYAPFMFDSVCKEENKNVVREKGDIED